MIINSKMLLDNHSVLPLLENPDFLHKNRIPNSNIFPVITEAQQIPPFQKKLPLGTTLTAIKMINVRDETEQQILPLLVAAGLNIVDFAEYSMLIYPSKSLIPFTSLQTGIFELIIDTDEDGLDFYSETFIMCSDLDCKIKVEYAHDENIETSNGLIVYDNYFWNRIYFDAIIGKPLYPEQIAGVDRQTVTFQMQQISDKRYRFALPLPEFLTDAIRTINLHDFKFITYLGTRYKLLDFNVSLNWTSNGDLAETTVEFQTDKSIFIINSKSTT